MSAPRPGRTPVMHALNARLLREGAITGLRLDHIDALFDPAAYLRALRAACGANLAAAEWRNVFTGETLGQPAPDAPIAVADALASFPVGLFVAEATP